jgi:hypothetical protein
MVPLSSPEMKEYREFIVGMITGMGKSEVLGESPVAVTFRPQLIVRGLPWN